MITVWKYEVPVDGEWHTLEIPLGSSIVHVGHQLGAYITLWAEVDTVQPKTPRTFKAIGTGWDIMEGDQRKAVHVGTLQEGEYVWHLYERYPHSADFWAGLTPAEKMARQERD